MNCSSVAWKRLPGLRLFWKCCSDLPGCLAFFSPFCKMTCSLCLPSKPGIEIPAPTPETEAVWPCPFSAGPRGSVKWFPGPSGLEHQVISSLLRKTCHICHGALPCKAQEKKRQEDALHSLLKHSVWLVHPLLLLPAASSWKFSWNTGSKLSLYAALSAILLWIYCQNSDRLLSWQLNSFVLWKMGLCCLPHEGETAGGAVGG